MLPPLLAMELEILVHDNVAILLEYPQYSSTFSQIPRPGVDFHMDSSVYCFSIRWGRVRCEINSGYYHVVNEAL